MGALQMKLEKEQLEQIGQYIRENLPKWQEYNNVRYELEIRERIVRVEEGTKHILEKMGERFEQVDKRFEQVQKNMDKRFEHMQENIDKRFEHMQENMDKRFEHMQENMDKRFEQMQKNMDKRFEQVDKRFERVYSFMKWQTAIGVTMVMGIYGSLIAIYLRQ